MYSIKVKSLQTSLTRLPKKKAEFIEPMECALVSKLPAGSDWSYEVKLDGYRAIGVKTSHDAILYSRNGKNFNKRYPLIAQALNDLPGETVIDGEVVALDDHGRPDFHALQHFQASASRIHDFVFDLLIWNGRDLTKLPLSERREHLASLKLQPPIRISEHFDISPDNMLAVVRQQGLEGVVAKRKTGLYEAGKRSKFIGLREGKDPRRIVKEHGDEV